MHIRGLGFGKNHGASKIHFMGHVWVPSGSHRFWVTFLGHGFLGHFFWVTSGPLHGSLLGHHLVGLPSPFRRLGRETNVPYLPPGVIDGRSMAGDPHFSLCHIH